MKAIVVTDRVRILYQRNPFLSGHRSGSPGNHTQGPAHIIFSGAGALFAEAVPRRWRG
jgi:hypothetical protein